MGSSSFTATARNANFSSCRSDTIPDLLGTERRRCLSFTMATCSGTPMCVIRDIKQFSDVMSPNASMLTGLAKKEAAGREPSRTYLRMVAA
nr:hypothetical protein CFP56_02581 [Quercus suber]